MNNPSLFFFVDPRKLYGLQAETSAMIRSMRKKLRFLIFCSYCWQASYLCLYFRKFLEVSRSLFLLLFLQCIPFPQTPTIYMLALVKSIFSLAIMLHRDLCAVLMASSASMYRQPCSWVFGSWNIDWSLWSFDNP